MTTFLGILLILGILLALFAPAPITSVSEAILQGIMRSLGALALLGLVLSCVSGFLVLGTQIALAAATAYLVVVWLESGPHLPAINWEKFDLARSFWSDSE